MPHYDGNIVIAVIVSKESGVITCMHLSKRKTAGTDKTPPTNKLLYVTFRLISSTTYNYVYNV